MGENCSPILKLQIMSRPLKTGLDYFPLDVEIDEKMELIEAKYGLIGFGIIIKLYQKIYRQGYFMEWNEDRLMLFKKAINVDINLINDVINDCLRYNIFDKNLYERFVILTSSGIQKRFLAACDRRKTVNLIKEYINIATDDINVDINFINVAETRVNQEFSTQSKVKESKVKESIVPPEVSVPINSIVVNFDFDKVKNLWNESCPSFPKILAITEARKLKLKIRIDEISGEKENYLEALSELFTKVESSKFLKGDNDRGWRASFDWLIANGKNWLKVLEGNYDNRVTNYGTDRYGNKKDTTNGANDDKIFCTGS